MPFQWISTAVSYILYILSGLIFGFKKRRLPNKPRTEDKENISPNYDPQQRKADAKEAVAMETHFKQVGEDKVDTKLDKGPSPKPPGGSQVKKEEDEAEEEEEEETEEEEEETEEEELEEGEEEEEQPIITLPKTPSPNLLNLHDDVTIKTESEVTPEGSVQRQLRREHTASPFKEHETVTEITAEKKGNMEAHTAKKQEFIKEISGDASGFKTPSPIPKIDSTPMFKVSKFTPGAIYSSSETVSHTSASTTTLSRNLSSFNDDLLNLTKKFEQGISARTPTPTATPTATPTPPPPKVVPAEPTSPPPPMVTNIPIAPPPPPPTNNNNKPRPQSMPSLDFNILDAIEKKKITSIEESRTTSTTSTWFSKTSTTTKDGHSINASDEESRRFQMLMKAFQPPPENEGEITPTRKKKMFSSSSFYEEPKHIYPTVEEQVKLCKSIADSLSSDTNQSSKGANMYIKRMKRAHKWVHEGPDPITPDNEPSQVPDSQRPSYDSFDRPRLKLVLDPRQLQDAVKLAKTGIYNEHNVISPDICFELVRDLNSPTGKGAQLFAKRKKKSEQWIVDESSVREAQAKQQLNTEMADVKPIVQQQRPYSYTAAAPAKPAPVNKLKEINERLNPKLKYIKSPWEAALESPIGCCDAAFEMVLPKPPPLGTLFATQPTVAPAPPLKDIVDVLPPTPVVNRAPVPPPLNRAPAPQPVNRGDFRNTSPYGVYPNVYKPKAPKGWTGYSADSQSTWYQEEPQEFNEYFATPAPQSSSYRPSSGGSSYPKVSLDQFQNYNATAKPWDEAKHCQNKQFRPVRPKSMIITK